MEKLIKKESVYYTQNINNLPIEDRTFFTEGLVANINDWREATTDEILEWKVYQKQQEELNNELMEEWS